MSFFGGKTKTEFTQRTTPYPAVMPGLGESIGLISNWVDRPRQFFPGQTYADLAPEELQALEQLRGAAGAIPGMYRGFLDPAREAWMAQLNAPEAAMGMGLQDVAGNPYLGAMADAIQSRVNRNLQENILPQIGANEVMGPSGAVARGIAARGTSDVLSENLANMYGTAWGRGLDAETSRYLGGLQAQQGAIGQTTGLTGLEGLALTQPADILSSVGATTRAQEQRGIDEAMARFDFNQMEPFTRGAMGLNTLMQPAIAFGETESQTEQSTSPSTWSNIGSLLTTAGMLGGGLFGTGDSFWGGNGLWGAGGFGMGAPGYGMAYNINPFSEQARMLSQQWGPAWYG